MLCKHCNQPFTITDVDRQFYHKIEVPEPTFCSNCRNQRRLAWRNERNLYRRKCDKTGRDIISMYSPDSPVVVFDQSEWWGDDWDPTDYGRDFDFSRPFFPQFFELKKVVPHFSLYNLKPVNSEYVNFAVEDKNCYLCFSAVANEDCYYSVNIDKSHDCLDCLHAQEKSELCYESIDIFRCYNCAYVYLCNDLVDSWFCYNCRNCSNCFGCVNLRNVSYYWFNQKLSAEEYSQRLKEFSSGSWQALELIKAKFWEHKKNFPQKYVNINKSIDSSGDYLEACKNVKNSFDVYNAEDCAYMIRSLDLKDCYDSYGILGELIYETMSAGYSNNIHFSLMCYYNHDISYCDICYSSQDLFGCLGLRSKKYCILNKQYSEEEYRKLRSKIIEHMKKTGEYGEYFPAQSSIFGYNETVAQEYYPLTKEVALKQGFNWQDNLPFTRGLETLKFSNIPDNIKEMSETILKEVLACQECGKNYKIINQELEFYRHKYLPIPRHCPECRHLNRLKLRNPRKLWERKCDQCGREVKTTYAPDRPEKIFCEECYQKEIY